MTVRIEELRKKSDELGYDAYLVTDEMNVKYLTGIPVPQRPCLLVKTDGDHVHYPLSDGLRAAMATLGNECEIRATDVGQRPFERFLEDLPGMNLKHIGFDSRIPYLSQIETLCGLCE